MGLSKIVVIIGIAAYVMLPADSASIGGSPDACFCTREYVPVCGSDDTTYSNNCEFDCAKKHRMDLDIKFYGECEDESKPLIEEIDQCICAFNYDPVCGSDGNTYASECELSCAKKINRNLELVTKGECIEVKTLPIEKIQEPEECVCTFIFDPVCGNDGKTYSSECEFNCAKKYNRNLEVFTRGQCVTVQTLPVERVEKIQEVQECVCTFVLDPVCGSDGRTYSNECELNCLRKFNRNLEVFAKGECVEIEQLPVEEVEKMQEDEQ